MPHPKRHRRAGTLAAAAAAASALTLASCATGPALSSAGEAAADAAIRAVLDDQVAAWNAGDIPGFMEGYWQSEALRFASGGSITTGYAQTLARYQARYTDAAAMGTLSFELLELDVLAPDAAVVFGRWKLTRAADTPQGLFTLTFKRLGGSWQIVADHTSSE